MDNFLGRFDLLAQEIYRPGTAISDASNLCAAYLKAKITFKGNVREK